MQWFGHLLLTVTTVLGARVDAARGTYMRSTPTHHDNYSPFITKDSAVQVTANHTTIDGLPVYTFGTRLRLPKFPEFRAPVKDTRLPSQFKIPVAKNESLLI